MKTLEKIRKHEVGDYEKIIKIIEKISTRKLNCSPMTVELMQELNGLKQMQDFCYKQIEIFDEWASEQCRLLGKDYRKADA